MERLNRFIAANPNGVAIVYAPAGYGKTTFLAHWIRQVEEAGGWLPGDGETRVAIVRHFFSPAMHLSPSPSHAFAHLLAQLTRLSDQPTPIPDRDDERWATLHNFLADSLKLPEGIKLVIVLDGLDDAEGEVEPFIPSQIPEGLFAVVSGRWDGEGELPNYLKKWARFTEFIPLKALSEEELREWLRTAGEGELARFAENDDFVRMLREKTDGLPLFVRYLMDDLLRAVKEGKSPEQVLERTPSGFLEYVREQFGQLAKLVRNEKGVRNLFALLTVAKGALRQDEVEELAGLSAWDLEGLPHQVTRWFSIGKTRSSADMPTYSFAHPLLAEEFRRHLGKEARQMEERLLKWCENWREHPSFPYILRHYAEHLYDKWRMTNEQMTYDALRRLALDSDFKQAQTQHLRDEPNLPLKTVQLALDAAIQLEDAPMMARLLIDHAKRAQSEEETPLQAWRKGHRERALRMATEIVFQRNHKLGTLWSLLLAWVAESEGEREWAKRFLDEIRKRWEGGKLEKLRDPDWQGEMAAFLLGELEQIEGAAEVAGLVLGDESKRKLATSWASDEEDAERRAQALGAIAEEMAKARMFDQALQVAEGIKDAEYRAKTLTLIATGMTEAEMKERAKEVFDQALQVAKGIKNEERRLEALGMITIRIARARMFNQALKVAEEFGETWWRAWALAAVAREMAMVGMEEQAKEVFEQALQVAEGIKSTKGTTEWAWALIAIVEEMTEAGMFDWALQVAEGIKGNLMRARALMAIAKEMMRAKMEERVKELFVQISQAAGEAVRWRADRKDALEILAEVAVEMMRVGMVEQAREVLDQVLQVVKNEYGDFEREAVLEEIAKSMANASLSEQAKDLFVHFLKFAERQIASDLPESKLKVLRVIAEYAERMARAGMQEQAQEIFEQAALVAEGITMAAGIPDPWRQADALMDIAQRIAKAGMFEQALEMAKRIERVWKRAETLKDIAGEMVKAGMAEQAKEVFEQALRVAGEIEPSELGTLRAKILREIAEGMARARMFDQALKVAERIEDAEEQAWAMKAIAVEMARAEMFEQALQVTGRVVKPLMAWSMAIREIVGGMVGARMFNRALEVAEGIEDRRLRTLRAEILRAIAEEMARARMYDRALMVAEGIEAEWRPSALGAIAGEMAKAEMREWAKEVFDQALRVAGEVEGGWWRVTALKAVAGEMAKAGIKEWAREVFEQALQVAERIEEKDAQAWALGAIGVEMAKAGMKERANEVFDRALRVAGRIIDDAERSKALKTIAEEVVDMARAGMTEQAKDVLEQVVQLAERIENKNLRENTLIEIVERMAKAGIFDQALKVAEAIEDISRRAEALKIIAEEMAKAMMTEEAKEVFDQALKLAEGIEDAWWRARALRKIAEGLAKAGEVEGAVGIMERETGMRTEMLPSVLKALAERAREGDGKSQRGFLRLLPLCGWSLELAYSACGLLARLYPHQAEGIALAVRGMPPAA
jgi:tetratricopeptide (TPR) repeat protein